MQINYYPNYFSFTDEKISNRRGFVAGTRDYLSPEIFSVQLTSSDDVMVEETKEKNLTELTGKVRIGFLFTKIYFCDKVKMIKTHGFIYYSKNMEKNLLSILLEHFIKHKHLISEE